MPILCSNNLRSTNILYNCNINNVLIKFFLNSAIAMKNMNSNSKFQKVQPLCTLLMKELQQVSGQLKIVQHEPVDIFQIS